MASTCGVSKSKGSREAAEAGEAALKELRERRFDNLDLLVIYIDGMVFGEHHVISAVGVDRAGHKHVLGIQPGATENAAAVEDLLQQLVARGVDPKAKRLLGIDGAKALRAAIHKVFGVPHPVQRCGITRSRTCVSACPRNRKRRGKRRCAPATSWRQKTVWRGCANWPIGWNRNLRRQRIVCGKGWKNVSPPSLGHSTVAPSLPGHDELD
jgi:hypothetical protein